MNLEKDKIIKIACVYAGTILGAGFASGQELLRFFVRYGIYGIFGVLFSGILFAVVGWGVLLTVYQNKIKSYPEFAKFILGKKLGKIMEIVVVIFLMILFSTMLAAGGSTIKQTFGFNYIIGVLIIAVLCFITFLFDVNGIVEINVILCPVLVVGGIFIGIYIFFNQQISVFNYNASLFKLISDNWIMSAVVYVSYNIITAISVLVSLNEFILNKKIAKFGAILGGACMGILGLCMSLPLFAHKFMFNEVELPILKIVLNYNSIIKYIYLIILLSAIFTTAVGNGFAVINWFCSRINIKPIFTKILIVVLGIIISQAGFSNFVDKVYPLFGYIGLIEMIMIVIAFVKTFLGKKKKI